MRFSITRNFKFKQAKLKAFRVLSLISFLFVATLVFINTSCNKKPETIGLDLVDYNKLYVGYDTIIDITAYSSIEDSVITDETSQNLLGSQYTNVFGLTNTSFYTQLRLSNIQPDFGENPQADSVIFIMVYSGYYGNISTGQTVKVFEINEDIYNDSSYYSNNSFDVKDIELANFTFVPNPNDSVLIDTVKYAAELRIPLNESFIDRIFTDADSTDMSSNDDFIDFFKGLYVTTENVTAPGEGAVLCFDLLNDRSNVTIYYNDTLSYQFVINYNNARVGKFEHDYSLSSDQTFIQQVVNGDTTLGTEKLYLQGLAGVKTTIKFPGLTEWIESGNIAISQAKLIIPAEQPADELAPPDNLVLFSLNEDGQYVFTADQLEGDDYFGGDYNSDLNCYQFRISFYIQDLVQGTPEYGLVLFPSGKSVKANQVTLFGTETILPQHIKLEVIYTHLNSK